MCIRDSSGGKLWPVRDQKHLAALGKSWEPCRNLVEDVYKRQEFQRQLQIQRTTEKDFRERIRSSILRNRLLANMVGRKVLVTKEAIAAYYNQHKQTFMNNQKVRFAVIVDVYKRQGQARESVVHKGGDQQ